MPRSDEAAVGGPARELVSARELKLAEDGGYVRLDGLDRDVELVGDLLVGIAPRDVAQPAWWLNLQARPDATIDLADGSRAVRARAAVGEERSRLWARMGEIDGYAALRPSETAVVILEPWPERNL